MWQIAQSSNEQPAHAIASPPLCHALAVGCAQPAYETHRLHAVDAIKHPAQYAHLPKLLHVHCGLVIDLVIYLAPLRRSKFLVHEQRHHAYPEFP